MTMEERIKRINELYHKSKAEGLNEAEKLEQQQLRQEYVAAIKGSLKAQLNNIDIQEADGSITNLGEKMSEKAESLDKSPEKGCREFSLDYRRSLSNRVVEQKSIEISNKVINSPYFEINDTIFLYCDYNKEVKTRDIFKRAIDSGKKVAYPKCDLKDGKLNLDFYYITEFNQLSPGYNGIYEPDIYNNDIKKVTEYKGLIVVPGVVFDKKCNRIGYGKGFYDRFLADKNELTKIGICYEGQIVDNIDVKDTDVPMDMVITENNIYCK